MIHKTLSDLLNWIVRQNEDLQLLIFAHTSARSVIAITNPSGALVRRISPYA